MAYLDMGAAIREKAISDKYDELKKHISSLDENGQVDFDGFKIKVNTLDGIKILN
jgi:hypothetical protein